jgi:hypothetical protein
MGRFTQAIGAAALAGVFTVSGSVVASAAPESPDAWSDCPSAYWCMWDRINGSGTVYLAHGTPFDDNLASPDVGTNDWADSVWNRTPRAICVYWDKDYSGSSIRFPGNGARSNLPVSWRNRVSSYRTIPNGVTSCNYE